MKLIDTDILIDHFHGHQAGAELATRNVKHYPMPNISVLVPYERGR